MARRVGGSGRASERRFILAGLLPAYLLMGATILAPLLVAFYTSWFAWDLRTSPLPTVFVGLRNFVRVFTDSSSMQVLSNTASLVVWTVAMTTVLGLATALLLHQAFPGRALLRSALLLPWAIPGIAAGTMWWWLYSARYGMLNFLLQTLGIIDRPVNWLTDFPLFAVIFANVWKEMPFAALLFLAGLQSISPELYEAAMVDGASAVQRFRHVTLPLLRNVAVVILIFQTASSLKMFDLIFSMTIGGPAGATTTLGFWAYLTSFRYWNFGFGAAIAFVTAALVLGLSGAYIVGIYRRIEV